MLGASKCTDHFNTKKYIPHPALKNIADTTPRQCINNVLIEMENHEISN